MNNLIIDNFLTLRSAQRDWSDLTYSDNIRVLGRYDKWLSENGLTFEDVEEEDFLRYWREIRDEYAVNTSNQHLVKIRAVYAWALRKKGIQIDGDPTAEIIRLKDDTFHNADIYTPEHMKAIYNSIESRFDDITFMLLAFTGMRREEIATLQWDNVEWDSDIINVFGKGRKWRRVPIHPALRETLEEAYTWYDSPNVVNSNWGKQIGLSRFNELMKNLLNRAEVPVFKRPIHAFRATFNQSLADELGADGDLTRKRIMGHANGDVNEEHYRAVSDEKMHRAILELYKSNPFIGANNA